MEQQALLATFLRTLFYESLKLEDSLNTNAASADFLMINFAVLHVYKCLQNFEFSFVSSWMMATPVLSPARSGYSYQQFRAFKPSNGIYFSFSLFMALARYKSGRGYLVLRWAILFFLSWGFMIAFKALKPQSWIIRFVKMGLQ